MQYLVTAHDGKDMLEKRLAVRGRHLDNIGRIISHVVCAGGILDDAGRMAGSVLVLDFDTREELDGYLKSEPYILEGVWQDVRVEPMNAVIVDGKMAGRKNG